MTPTRTSRFSTGVVLTLCLAAGCAGNSRKLAIRPESIGAYRFTEHVGDGVDLEGIFVVGADSVSIEATPGPCRYERERSNALVLNYTCSDVTYVFDRADPVRLPHYTATVRIRESRSVCVRYVVNSQGRSVCAEYRNETSFRDVRRTGTLRPQRMANDDPNHPAN